MTHELVAKEYVAAPRMSEGCILSRFTARPGFTGSSWLTHTMCVDGDAIAQALEMEVGEILDRMPGCDIGADHNIYWWPDCDRELCELR